MGHTSELFVEQPVNENFLCTICQDVLEDAVRVDPCEHLFCRGCISKWSSKHGTCPSCRQKVKTLKDPQREFTSLLNGLKLQCPHHEAGCEEILKLDGLEAHEKRECEFNPEREYDCTGGCGHRLKKKEMADHSCVAYLKKKVDAYKAKYGELPDDSKPASNRPVKKVKRNTAATQSATPTSASTPIATASSSSSGFGVAWRETAPTSGTPVYNFPRCQPAATPAARQTIFRNPNPPPQSGPAPMQRNPFVNWAFSAPTPSSPAPTLQPPNAGAFNTNVPQAARPPAASSPSSTSAGFGVGFGMPGPTAFGRTPVFGQAASCFPLPPSTFGTGVSGFGHGFGSFGTGATAVGQGQSQSQHGWAPTQQGGSSSPPSPSSSPPAATGNPQLGMSIGQCVGFSDQLRDTVVNFVRQHLSTKFPQTSLEKHNTTTAIRAKMVEIYPYTMNPSGGASSVWSVHLLAANQFCALVPPTFSARLDITINDLLVVIWR